jgi:hypothetical protein
MIMAMVCIGLIVYIIILLLQRLWIKWIMNNSEQSPCVNLLNAELNPIRHLLALAGARHFVNVSRIRVNIASVTQ